MSLLASLLLKIGVEGADQAVNSLNSVDAKMHAVSHSVGSAAGEFSKFEFSALNAVGAATAFTFGIKELAGMFGEFSGLNVANKFADIQQGLAQVTGSAQTAHDMMKQLKDLGAATPFDTAELASFSTALINMGTDAKQAIPQLKTLADIAAFAKLPRAQMPRFMQEVQELRGQSTPHMQQIMELVSTNHIPLSKLLNAGMGTHFADNSQAMHGIGKMSGEQFYQGLLKGGDALAHDAALMASMSSPLAVVANLMENLEMIMETTGELIQAVMLPVLIQVEGYAKSVKDFNESTGGWGGLVVLGNVMAGIGKILTTTFVEAITGIKGLTRSLQGLAVAAVGARGPVAVQAGLAGIPPVMAFATGGKGAAVAESAVEGAAALRGLPRFFAGIKGIGLAGIAGMKGLNWAGAGSMALKGLKATPWGLVGVAGSMGLEAWGHHIGGHTGGVVSGIGTGVGIGAMGFMLGPIAGAITTALGGIIGGAIGGNSTGQIAKNTDAIQQAIADNTKITAQAVTEMKGTLLGGGGDRSRRTTSQIEGEVALATMMGRSWTG